MLLSCEFAKFGNARIIDSIAFRVIIEFLTTFEGKSTFQRNEKSLLYANLLKLFDLNLVLAIEANRIDSLRRVFISAINFDSALSRKHLSLLFLQLHFSSDNCI
jgi:hypothetical protein